MEKIEQKELTFRPSLTKYASSGTQRTNTMNGKPVTNVYEALYAEGLQKLQNKESLKKKKSEEVINMTDFVPTISQQSEKLARRARKKRFMGAAVALTPPQHKEMEESAPSGATPERYGRTEATAAANESPAAVQAGQDTEQPTTMPHHEATSSSSKTQTSETKMTLRKRPSSASSRLKPPSLPPPQSQSQITRHFREGHTHEPTQQEESWNESNRDASKEPPLIAKRSSSADAAGRRKKMSIFDQLYEERHALHRGRSTPTERPPCLRKSRKDENVKPNNVEHVSERLYRLRDRKKELQKLLLEKDTIRMLGRDPAADKILKPKDVSNKFRDMFQRLVH